MKTGEILLIGAATFVVALLLAGALIGGVLARGGERPAPVAVAAGEYQEATLSWKNWAYVVEPELVVGVPVRMTVDLSTVQGCMRDVVIREFGVRKYVRPDDNVIEFTPTRTGTIGIACSMNMGTGTFKVVS